MKLRKTDYSVLALAGTFLAVLLTLASGCGEEAPQTTPAATRAATGARTYSTDPAGTSRLLRDASAAIQEQMDTGAGVHFTMDSISGAGGVAAATSGEGDMVFPDRVKMTMKKLFGGQETEVELIAIGGTIYSRSASTGGIWQSSSSGYSPPDPQSIKSYLDFTRSSRNFGQESLRGGIRTIHIQVDVDTMLAAEEAKKHTSDPAALKAIEATKGATLTVDFWIGADNLLVYQEVVKISGPAAGTSSETTFRYSDWGETVEIERPCEAC